MKTIPVFKFRSFSGKSIYHFLGLFSFTIVLTSPSVATASTVLPKVALSISGILMQVFSYFPRLVLPFFVIFTIISVLVKDFGLSLLITFFLLPILFIFHHILVT